MDHGSDVYTLHYVTGTVRFEHVCVRPRDNETLLIAPMLTGQGQVGGHQVVSISPVTITPSILCTDCGMHGFITGGKWIPC